jgi:hypothetical protein
MHTVNVPNIDGRIWNVDSVVAEIADAMHSHLMFAVTVDNEGPCAHSLGLYRILDDLCEKFSYTKTDITIITRNQLEHHSKYVIKRLPPFLHLGLSQQQAQTDIVPKVFDNDFKHFGSFVGRSNWPRLYVSSYLFKQHRDKTLMTFHYNADLDFHQSNLGLDDLVRLHSSHLTDLEPCELVAAAPIKYDAIDTYPIVAPDNAGLAGAYRDFFVEIAYETYSQGNSFFPTEKIWRPMANKTPFILQGSQHYLEHLRNLGFKTFGAWWDEGYNNDDYASHPDAICNIIDKLAAMPTTELQAMYYDMSDTLAHNQHVVATMIGKK